MMEPTSLATVADSDDVAQAFRDDVAYRNDMIAPTIPI
jgi:hypothetical protein